MIAASSVRWQTVLPKWSGLKARTTAEWSTSDGGQISR